MLELTEIEDQLRQELRALAEPVAATGRIDDRIAEHRRRRSRAVALRAVAAVFLVGLAAGVVAVRHGDDDGSERVRATTPEAVEAAGGSWRRIPQAPLSPRQRPAVVWAGDRLVVWSGLATCSDDRMARCHPPAPGERRVDGATWDPSTREWSPMAPPPGDLALAPLGFAVWTGAEVVVGPVEPATGDERVRQGRPQTLLAYDPQSDVWRTIPQPRSGIGIEAVLRQAATFPDGAVGLWQVAVAGGEVVLGTRADLDASDGRDGILVALDPRTGRVRDLAPHGEAGMPSPLRVTQLAPLDDRVWVTFEDRTRSWILDPAGDPRWTPVAPTEEGIGDWRAPVWTGADVVYAADWVTFDSRGAARTETRHRTYDPVTDRWRRIPAGNVGPPAPIAATPQAVWTGSVVLSPGATYEPRTGTWRVLPLPALDPGLHWDRPTLAWTGRHAILFGGDQVTCRDQGCWPDGGVADLSGWIYRP